MMQLKRFQNRNYNAIVYFIIELQVRIASS